MEQNHTPCSPESERMVIGSILLDKDCCFEVLETCSSQDFFYPLHQEIMAKTEKMVKNQESVDLWSLSEGEIPAMKDLLIEISSDVMSSEGVIHHAKNVKKKSFRRQVLKTCVETIKKVKNQDVDENELLKDLQGMLFRTEDVLCQQKLVSVKDLVPESLKLIERAYNGELSGLKTGFKKFDSELGGLNPGNLIILGGRPKYGKTTLAISIAANVAKDHQVAVFSLEMGDHELILNLIAAETGINSRNMRIGRLCSSDFPKIVDGAGSVRSLNLFIDQSASSSPMSILSKCRRLKAVSGLSFVVVDYIQLMKPDIKEGNREQQISQISRGLKLCAKELNVPVLALSQLNRSVENREDKRPILADLRESGAIEQDADMVSFLYRPSPYDPQAFDYEEAEWLIRAYRHGPPGMIPLKLNSRCNKFEDTIA